MNVDEASANCTFFRNMQGGDTGRRRVEHRNFSELSNYRINSHEI